MRYCPHCRRLSPGYPVICHYCGRTWYVRLCPRGHENPSNAQFCGACGSTDLSETAGSKPWTIYFLKILIIVVLCIIIISIGKLFLGSIKGESSPVIFSFIISIVLLIGAYIFALSLLPQAVKSVFLKLNRFISACVIRITLWFIMKAKELIELLIKW